MKKKIEVEFFSTSKKWPRRVPKIRIITSKILKLMHDYFDINMKYHLNLILSEKNNIKKINKKFKNKYKDTDVLTFVTKFVNKDLGNIFYCDIFFSIDTINKYIKNNNIDFYDHFTHLLIHSLLHVNGYDHKKDSEFKKMKNIETKILNNLDIKNPYLV